MVKHYISAWVFLTVVYNIIVFAIALANPQLNFSQSSLHDWIGIELAGLSICLVPAILIGFHSEMLEMKADIMGNQK